MVLHEGIQDSVEVLHHVRHHRRLDVKPGYAATGPSRGMERKVLGPLPKALADHRAPEDLAARDLGAGNLLGRNYHPTLETALRTYVHRALRF